MNNTDQAPIIQEYMSRTKKSQLAFEKAKSVVSGGIARNSVFYRPYPAFLRSGKGSHVVDLDGNELVDFLNNFTSLIHGHADPDILRAVEEVLELGTAFGAPNEYEYRLADMVSKRMPSIEQMRFACSGTEATHACIMAARAYTKRRKIVKFEGGFHGIHEDVLVSTHPSKEPQQPFPRGELDSIGVNPSILDSTLALPYNRIENVQRLLATEGDSIAAIIVEPVIGVGGEIPGKMEFLQGLRELCTRYGVLLIFDEIVTGFRLALGGAQEKYNVRADITALAKNLGGGFPVGGFGASKEIMRVFDPAQGAIVPWSGTFAANPITLAAGIACLEKLTSASYEKLDAVGAAIESAFVKLAKDIQKYPVNMVRSGSLFNFHFTDRAIVEARDVLTENAQRKHHFFLSMFNEGVMIGARGLCCASTAMKDQDVQAFKNAMEKSLSRIQEELTISSATGRRTTTTSS